MIGGKKLSARMKTFLPEVRRSRRMAFLWGFLLGLALLVGSFSYAVLGPQGNFVQQQFATPEVDSLNERLLEMEEETRVLRDDVARSMELIKLDQEARSKMSLLITNLEAENARLKEDLAFFEGFIPGSVQGAISLKRLQIDRDTIPNQYRYKALVIQGNQRPEVDLTVQVLVKVLNNGKSDVIVFPSTDNVADPQYNIKLVRFSRVGGLFQIPEGSKLQSVELRILDSGAIRAQSTLKM